MMDLTEPGVFRKGDMVLTVYVDDNLMSGPSKKEIVAEREAIFKRFPGKVIE